MPSLLKSSIIVGATALVLAGCQRDVNLSKDVDLLMQQSSQPTPFIPQAAAPNTQAPLRQMPPKETATVTETAAELKVQLVTQTGAITIQLLPKEAPNTVKNFLAKVRSGFYAGLTFHRVEDWVVQGGDPLGTGTGGGTMPTELSQTPFKIGSVGVARGGDIMVSNDAQFFICIKDCSWLTGQYTLFGEVTEGLDIAQQLNQGAVIDAVVDVSN